MRFVWEADAMDITRDEVLCHGCSVFGVMVAVIAFV